MGKNDRISLKERWGCGMDTFMDKLAQKLTAAEMIKANTAAEAAQMDMYREQIAGYEKVLERLAAYLGSRDLNDEKRKEELAAVIAKLNEKAESDGAAFQEITAKLQELMDKPSAVDKKAIEELFQRSDDFNHKEDVKVYRNVQAALVEENEKQTQLLTELITSSNKKLSKKLTVTMIFAILGFLAGLGGIALQIVSGFLW